MTPGLIHILTSLSPTLVLVTLGIIVRRRGPVGFVHGLVDWRRIDPPTRQRAGKVVGNDLLAMGLLIMGHALYVYRRLGDAAALRMATLVLSVGVSALALVMVVYLARLPTQDDKRRHGR